MIVPCVLLSFTQLDNIAASEQKPFYIHLCPYTVSTIVLSKYSKHIAAVRLEGKAQKAEYLDI